MSSSDNAPSEPSAAEKVDFVRAVYRGIEPGTEAARSVARKKSGSNEDEPQVELLRRIPAASASEPENENEVSALAMELAAEIDRALADGDIERIQPHAQQALMSALCRLYSANDENGNRFGVLGPKTTVTATDAMVLCGALLEAVDLQVFELGLWQSWSSR